MTVSQNNQKNLKHLHKCTRNMMDINEIPELIARVLLNDKPHQILKHCEDKNKSLATN